jgi:hypothetical protein
VAFLESLVQREMGGRPAGTPQTAGLPAPAPASPTAPNPPAVGAGIGGGRPSVGSGPAPFATPASPSPTGFGAGGGGGTSPALPPAPASLPQSPGALPPSPTAAGRGASRPAAATPAAAPYQVQLDRAPSPGDFAEHGGASFQTPYGIASRGPDGKVSYLFSPDGEARYQRDLAAKQQRFGPLPSLLSTLPNLPKPSLTLEGSGYNPFSNQFVR